MQIDFKSELLALQAKIINKNLYHDELIKIADLNAIEIDEYKIELAELFYETLKQIQLINAESIIKEFHNDVIRAFYNISLINSSNENHSSVFIINFLNILFRSRDEAKLLTKSCLVEDKLEILLRDLDPIKFIFNMVDENGKRYFPINKLLNEIIGDENFINTSIERYHLNVLKLAVEMYSITNDDPSKEFNYLISNCNLKFIKYLNGTSELIDTKDMSNFKKNNVMLFFDSENDKVLVRHESKNYFINKGEIEIEEEVNTRGLVIGYFCEYKIFGEVLSYHDAIIKKPVEFLKLVYEKGFKNVLLEKQIIKQKDGSFTPLNRFCKYDNWVIVGNNTEENSKVYLASHFYKSLEGERMYLFSIGSMNTPFNKISLGFCCKLLDYENISIDDLFCNVNSANWLQNNVARNWLNHVKDKKKSILYLLEYLLKSLEYCSKKSNLERLEFKKDCIIEVLPYYVDLDYVYMELGLPRTPSIVKGSIIQNDDVSIIDFSSKVNETIASKKYKDNTSISLNEVNVLDSTDLTLDLVGNICIFQSGDSWCTSLAFQNEFELVKDLEVINEKLLPADINDNISVNDYNKLKEIFKLHKQELLDIPIKDVDLDSLIQYRIAYNMVYNNIHKDNWNLYSNCFKKSFLMKFHDISSDEDFSIKQDNVLYVPKDRSQEDGVLKKIYNNYIRRNCRRDNDWWFAAPELTLNGGNYCINNNQIRTICFLFDNTLNGTATIRTLAVKLNKKDEWLEFVGSDESNQTVLTKKFNDDINKCDKYYCGGNEVSLEEIIRTNKPKLEICIYYGTVLGENTVNNFLQACNIFNFQVKVKKRVKDKRNCFEEEKKAFNLGDIDFYPVIREYNMPKKTALPKRCVGDTAKVITLLAQKREN